MLIERSFPSHIEVKRNEKLNEVKLKDTNTALMKIENPFLLLGFFLSTMKED